jgi:predicted aspartyl protease
MLIAATLFLFFQFPSVNGGKPVPPNPELDSANHLLLTGKFSHAEKAYQLLLTKTPDLEAAEVGIVRSMLRQQKIDESLAVVNKALAAQPSSAVLLAAKGDVLYRRGEISSAETSYKAAIGLNPQERAHRGLRRSTAQHPCTARPGEHLQTAHHIDPDDVIDERGLNAIPEGAPQPWKHSRDLIQTTREQTIPRDELSPENTIGKPATTDWSVSRSAAKSSEILHAPGPSLRGWARTFVDNQPVKLLLDTGAPGILVDRRVAESAHLTRISAAHQGGFGDEGLQSGYSAVVEHIRVGDLEFQDCLVSVSNNDRVLDQDGTIGTNLFASYLIDLDIPAMRMRLGPLPKRPEEPFIARKRKGSAEDPINLEVWAEQSEGELNTKFSLRRPPGPGPQDRYISPEMADWTRVFRAGHLLLVPTNLDESAGELLFGIDTGAPFTILSTHVAGQFDKSSSKIHQNIRGLSGQVKTAYSTQATVSFAGLERRTKKLTAVDLSSTNRRMGIEISGMLGFGTLRLLDLKLDYRDGLVDFIYASEQEDPSPAAQPDSPKSAPSCTPEVPVA